MAYAIMRVEKRNRSAVHGLQIEATRKSEDHDNGRDFDRSDINWDKTDENIRLIETQNWNSEITRQIKENGVRERKDSIVMIDGVYTASPEFFENKSDKEIRDFFEECLNFHIDNYCQGDKSRMISAIIHLDETTPHLQVASVPLIFDEKGAHLSAKRLMGDRNTYRTRQDRFWTEIGAKRGLERGELVKYDEKELENGQVIMSRAEESKTHATKREWQIASQELEITKNRVILENQKEEQKRVSDDINSKIVDFNQKVAEKNQQINDLVEIRRKELKEIEATKKLMEQEQERLKAIVDNTYKRLQKSLQERDVDAPLEEKLESLEKVLSRTIKERKELDDISQKMDVKGHGNKVTMSREDYELLTKRASLFINRYAEYNKIVQNKEAIINGAKADATKILKKAEIEAFEKDINAAVSKDLRKFKRIVKLMEKDAVPGSKAMLSQLSTLALQMSEAVIEEAERS